MLKDVISEFVSMQAFFALVMGNIISFSFPAGLE